jgi:O-antigen biosynthesis protein
MRIAIYTPTHQPAKLSAAAQSVMVAAHVLQELRSGIEVVWHIVVNGGADWLAQRPAMFGAGSPLYDAGVNVITHTDYRGTEKSVGALKAFACEKAIEAGATHLLELDHDDELHEDALREVCDAFASGAGFVASDTACETRFPAEYGWVAEALVVNERRLWVNITPEICARSLFEIFYAPNHLRAWSVEAYAKAGGYDARLEVCDDQDLLCRTYIAGVDMRLIHRPLYIQHESPDQTQVVRNKVIQSQQREIGARYLYQLAAEQARRQGLKLLDLGGAHGAPAGFETVDVRGNPDHKVNVGLQSFGLPDSSVGVIRAHDFLEHIAPHRVVAAMNEFYRVLAPGGWLLTSTPSTDGRGAFQDPTHVSFWNSNSFWYYTNKEQAAYVPSITARFQLARIVNRMPTKFHELHNIVYCEAALWCLKGQQQIGQVLI